MTSLSFCGVAAPLRRNSWPQRPLFIGDAAARMQDGRLAEVHTRRVREWQGVKIRFQAPAFAHAMRALIEGEFFSASFDRHACSHDGIEPVAGSDYTRTDAGGVHGGMVTPASGDYLGYALRDALGVPNGWFPVKGWTLLVHKKLTTADDGVGGAGTWYHFIATGSVAVTQGAAANPGDVTQYRDGVAGNYSMGNWIQVGDDGEVRVYGKDNDGSNNAKDYDDLVLLPFALPSATWATQLAAFCADHAFARAPYALIQGDVLPDLSPLEVRVTVEDEENVNFSDGGTWVNNGVELVCTVRER